MSGESALTTGRPISAEACRRFLFERGDISLGVMPQLLLPDKEADLWAFFWYACRQVDDSLESGPARHEDFLAALREGRAATSAEQAVQLFLQEAQPYFEPAPLRAGMERALFALDQERAFREPPRLEDYLRVVVAKAGFPLLVLNTLLLPGEPGSVIQRFSYLLAVSIQLGDDCRDIRRDRDRGVHFLSREEAADVRALGLAVDSEEGLNRIGTIREAVCKWLALRALDVGERLVNKPTRDLARTEVLLWLHQIDTGQLRELHRPLKWPGALADFLQPGVPSGPRLAAARLLVRNNPTLFGDPRRWDEKNRQAVLKLLAAEVPQYYLRALSPE